MSTIILWCVVEQSKTLKIWFWTILLETDQIRDPSGRETFKGGLKLEDLGIPPKVKNLPEFGIPSSLCFLIMFPTISDPMTTQITLCPDFFCQVYFVANLLPTCCQLVANCCQRVANLLPIVANLLPTSWQQVGNIWFCDFTKNMSMPCKKIVDYLLMWIREDSTHPSLIPRWRKVVVSPRFTPSHPPTKMCSKSIISRATALFSEAHISELSGSWVNNKVSSTLVPTFHEIFNERSDFPINRLLCRGKTLFLAKKRKIWYTLVLEL